MVDTSSYDFTSLADKTIKPEESFINSYIDKCLKDESVISSTQMMRRILDAKYEKEDINKAISEQCQHLTISRSVT